MICRDLLPAEYIIIFIHEKIKINKVMHNNLNSRKKKSDLTRFEPGSHACEVTMLSLRLRRLLTEAGDILMLNSCTKAKFPRAMFLWQ